MVLTCMIAYGTKLAKIDDREDLGRTLSIILNKLNQNFFAEKGIIFDAGPHGTWIEMRISDDAWGEESVATTVEAFEDNDHGTPERRLSIPNDQLLHGHLDQQPQRKSKFFMNEA